MNEVIKIDLIIFLTILLIFMTKIYVVYTNLINVKKEYNVINMFSTNLSLFEFFLFSIPILMTAYILSKENLFYKIAYYIFTFITLTLFMFLVSYIIYRMFFLNKKIKKAEKEAKELYEKLSELMATDKIEEMKELMELYSSKNKLIKTTFSEELYKKTNKVIIEFKIKVSHSPSHRGCTFIFDKDDEF